MKLRISIAGFLGLLIPAGLGFAALCHPSRLWASAIFLLTWMILLASIFGVTYRRGVQRAFWLGFLVCGWSYWVLSSNIIIDYRYTMGYAEEAEEHLADNQLLVRDFIDLLRLDRQVPPRSPGEKAIVRWGGSFYPATIIEAKADTLLVRYDGYPDSSSDEWVTFDRIMLKENISLHKITNHLVILAIGFLGGLVAVWFQQSQKRSSLSLAPTLTPTSESKVSDDPKNEEVEPIGRTPV